MSYFIGICRHCGSKLGMSLILCDSCAHKVLDILPADPKERIAIYNIIIDETQNPISKWCAEKLKGEAVREVENQVLGTIDIFEERG